MPKVLNFKVIIEQAEDGLFVAEAPAIPGAYTQGKTYEEVVRRIREVIELCLEEAKVNVAYKAKIDFSEAQTDRFIGVTNVPVRVTF